MRRAKHARKSPRVARTLLGATAATSAFTGAAALSTGTASAATIGDTAVFYASQEAGDPYVYGAVGPNAFDCSGFTRYVYGRLGISLPHSSSAQYSSTPRVAPSAKQPGDLLFFFTGGSVTHVAIYAGGNSMWAAPHSGDVVKLQSIYSSAYAVGRPYPSGPSPDEQAITAHWNALGGNASFLGGQTTGYTTIPGRGAYVGYAGGAITSAPGAGVHETHGDIRGRWAATGFEAGRLGFPTTDTARSTDGRGTWQGYQGGAISWTASTGAHATRGPQRDVWAAKGFEFGVLGYPTTEVTPSTDGRGNWQGFEGGAITWSAATNAHETHGPIRDAWAKTGFEFGKLGYPTTDVTKSNDGKGTWSNFEHGAITWSPTTGAHVTYGAIREAWRATGFEFGSLGYPKSEQYTAKDGSQVQDFERGSIRIAPGSASAQVALASDSAAATTPTEAPTETTAPAEAPAGTTAPAPVATTTAPAPAPSTSTSTAPAPAPTATSSSPAPSSSSPAPAPSSTTSTPAPASSATTSASPSASSTKDSTSGS